MRDASTITISPRALGALTTALRRSLIAAASFAQRPLACGARAGAMAVAPATITQRADKDGGAAVGAQKTADGIAHCRSATTEKPSTTARALCYVRGTLVHVTGAGHGIRVKTAKVWPRSCPFFSGRFQHAGSSGTTEHLSS